MRRGLGFSLMLAVSPIAPGILLLAAGCVLFAFARAALARPEARRDWDRGKMTWPFVGETVTAMETSRVMRSLSSLLSGGVPILHAFVIAREVSGNTAIREGMEAARLKGAQDRLLALSPLAVLGRGYAVVTKKELVVASRTQVRGGDEVHIRVKDGEFDARVTGE